MKAKLLKVIRKRFAIIQYWNDDVKEMVIMHKNNKTGFVDYHTGRERFKHFYESVSWQMWQTFDYKLMWENRINSRYQRKLNKEFNNIKQL